MSEALNATGRPIYYSLCEWGEHNPHLWASNIANSWRTSMDIKDKWISMLWNLNSVAELSEYAGPELGWNDPDMLEVGNGGMTNT